jgi:hypothetical protein
LTSKKRDPSHRRKVPLNIAPNLKGAGTIGTMQEYRTNVAMFARIVRDPERKKTLSTRLRMDELITLNKMLATLYDMQEKIEKKVVRKEGTEEQEEEIVEIKKGEVTVTVPKEPEMHEDKESLVHSLEFGGILMEMPVQLVEKKKEPVPEPEVHPALKEIFS